MDNRRSCQRLLIVVLDVIGGPQESAGLVWWQVRIQGSDQEGWAAAGGDGSVYLEPVPGP